MLVNYHTPRYVYIVCGNTDLRKGIDTLAILIADNFGLDLYDDSLFLFCGRRNDRFKALYWDGEGFILLYKRFDNGRLTWPRNSEEITSCYGVFRILLAIRCIYLSTECKVK